MTKTEKEARTELATIDYSQRMIGKCVLSGIAPRDRKGDRERRKRDTGKKKRVKGKRERDRDQTKGG